MGSGIGMAQDGRLIGGALYYNYNGASVWMTVAGEGQWLSKTFLWTCFAYPFKQLRVRKVLAQVAGDNRASLALCKAAGFEHEATLKDADPNGDILIMSLTRDQCRWLNIRVDLHGQIFRTNASGLQ
jgi:RimJ/RimL family protein N-acetyltransferase